jgi:phosphotransferase system  glucose/maltose/N-acetylglucosamine-specific IIC component
MPSKAFDMHFTFKREAKWLLILSLALPAIGILFAIVWPVVARWLGAR